MGNLPFIGVILAALIAGVSTYLVAKRQTSSKIEDSPAALIWQESEALRKEWRERCLKVEKGLAEAQTLIEKLRVEIIDCLAWRKKNEKS